MLVSVILQLKHIIIASLIRLSYYCIGHYFYFKSHLKQLYISNKMEHFNYKGGCGVCSSKSN